MKTITNILATITTIIGVPLIWHTIMPQSAHWMTGTQIGFAIMLFVILASGYTVCWLSLNNKI